ncbi:MAG: NAD(P)/FAD-dependent oxidoreductase [Proteobacteria bacterium]|nr:NAD(P)/FAD-dependent oxidoreductase [Pseudomonadota bacterium]
MKKHIIIGSGPAGLVAAEKIKELVPEDEVKIVTKESCFPYSPAVLPHLLSGKGNQETFWSRNETHFKKLGVVFERGREVMKIEPDQSRISFADGGSATYDRLLIASGSEGVAPPIQGLEEVGFVSFHTLEDYQRLLQLLEGRENVTILGAGMIGMELAAALTERNHQVRVIEMENRLLPLYFEEGASALIKEVFSDKGVEILTGRKVVKVEGGFGRINVICADGEPLKTDLLLTCTGVKARTTFLQDSGIKLNQGVVVDQRMQTSKEGVFAAGDVAEALSFKKKERGLNPILFTALAQGKIAGENMAGLKSEYKGWIPLNVFRFFGNMAASVGASGAEGEEYDVMEEIQQASRKFRKLVFSDGRLEGATFINEDINPGLFWQIIERQLDLRKYRDLLFKRPAEMSTWLIHEHERGKSN